MNERTFTDELLERMNFAHEGCTFAPRVSLLYDLTVDEDGSVRMGIDTDSGEPIRGRGKGFEQDLLLFEAREGTHTSVVPRVVIEVKFRSVTTHDVIVYSEKARRVRSIYPYVRYGILLGGMANIPGRVLRLGQGFDFMLSMVYPFTDVDICSARNVLSEELAASRELSCLSKRDRSIVAFRRVLRVTRGGNQTAKPGATDNPDGAE